MFPNSPSRQFVLLTDTNEIDINGQKVKLSPKEAGVMKLLMDRHQATVSRTEILEKVWGDKFANDQGLTQAISRLRRILESNPKTTIRTIPKKGYLLQTPAAKRSSPKSIRINLHAALIFFLIIVIGILVFIRRIEIRVDKLEPEVKEGTISTSSD